MFGTRELSDSSLIAMFSTGPPGGRGIAAYLTRWALAPEDLSRHQCLVLGETRQWSFVRNGVGGKHGSRTGSAAIQQRRASLAARPLTA